MDRRAFHSELLEAQRQFNQIHAEFVALRRMMRERKFDDDQPRAPAGSANGGQWVSAGGTTSRTAGETRVAAAGVLAPAVPFIIGQFERQAIMGGITAGMAALGALLQARPDAAGVVVQFNAAEFKRGADRSLIITSRGTLKEDEVRAVCPRFDEIQSMVDETTARVRLQQPDLLPWVFGTAVHLDLKRQIDSMKDPSLRAEISLANIGSKMEVDDKEVRIDIFEFTKNGDVCIDDVKTGRRGLTLFRTQQLGDEVNKILKHEDAIPGRIILSEIRPRQ